MAIVISPEQIREVASQGMTGTTESLSIKDVLVALGCRSDLCQSAQLRQSHTYTHHGPAAIDQLRLIGQQPWLYLLRPWVVLDLVRSDPQALAYACSDPWLSVCVVLGIARVSTDRENEYYEHYEMGVLLHNEGSRWCEDAYARYTACRRTSSGLHAPAMLCAAFLLWRDIKTFRALADAVEPVREMLDEFVHATLGAWNACVISSGSKECNDVLRRLCVDISTCEIHSNVRYDPNENYDWSSTEEDELPLATRVASASHEDNVWLWIEFLAALYHADGAYRRGDKRSFSTIHQERLMALATKLSGRP